MSSISDVPAVTAFRRAETPDRTAPRPGAGTPAANVGRGGDQVELSSQAREASGTEPSIRADLVTRIRAEIKAGTYETSERLDGAIDALANDLLT